MLLRVKATGAGQPGDPVRVDLPTYSLVGFDPVSMMATVDVPDPDLPPNMPQAGDPKRPNTPYGPVLIQLDAASHSTWSAGLRGRYNRGSNWAPPQVA